MTISRCLHHAQRIGALPIAKWAAEANALPERCEHDDCSTGNCRKVCQDWLRMQFLMLKTKRRLDDMDAKRRRAGR
jgi:hypothetical protein